MVMQNTMNNIAQVDVKLIDFPSLPTLPYDNACVTIGNFDGVHIGHQAIITRMAREAKKESRTVLVVTFFPNPYLFFTGQTQPFYLSTPYEKELNMLALGVDRVITFRFNQDFANLSAETFLLTLKQKLGLSVLVVGEDFALGKDRQGTIPVLTAIGEEHGFGVKTISQVRLSKQEVSSTLIRKLLDEGTVDRAASLLGRLYRVSGEVIHGSDRGARIGLPTANISYWPQKKLPAVGVYATWVHLKGQVFQGITNIGFRPTFETGSEVNVETHILDFDANIYGEKISLDFVHKLRDERKFSGIDALLAQITLDKAEARRIFSHESP